MTAFLLLSNNADTLKLKDKLPKPARYLMQSSLLSENNNVSIFHCTNATLESNLFAPMQSSMPFESAHSLQ